jgi:predicted homoserine dehydrogenase-like protein
MDDIPRLMRPKSAGGVLEQSGTVEVISSLASDGTEIPYNIRNGVWVCVEAANDYQRNCLEEYHVVTDDTGRYTSVFKRWHLIGLELGMSVASIGVRHETTGTPRVFNADVVSVAKRDLNKGEILDGEGGYTVAGDLRPSSVSLEMRGLPLGLACDLPLKNDVRAGAVLTYDDVDVDNSLSATQLRLQMESRARELQI